MASMNSLFTVIIVLLLLSKNVSGLHKCESTDPNKYYGAYEFCKNSENCCGIYNDKCCEKEKTKEKTTEHHNRTNTAGAIVLFVVVFILPYVCCCVGFIIYLCLRNQNVPRATGGVVYASSTPMYPQHPPQWGGYHPSQQQPVPYKIQQPAMPQPTSSPRDWNSSYIERDPIHGHPPPQEKSRHDGRPAPGPKDLQQQRPQQTSPDLQGPLVSELGRFQRERGQRPDMLHPQDSSYRSGQPSPGQKDLQMQRQMLQQSSKDPQDPRNPGH